MGLGDKLLRSCPEIIIKKKANKNCVFGEQSIYCTGHDNASQNLINLLNIYGYSPRKKYISYFMQERRTRENGEGKEHGCIKSQLDMPQNN